MRMAVTFDMEDIVSLISDFRTGNIAAFDDIVTLYTPMMQKVAHKFSLDFDEVFSEACMALYRAAISYDVEQSDVTFGLYAKICVNNSLCDYVRRESYENRVDDGADIDRIADATDVVSYLVRKEERERFRRDARELLSEYEYRVLIMWLGGDKTADIATALSVSAKSVDNAKARVLKKLRDGLRPPGV